MTTTNSSMSVDGENDLGDYQFGIVVYEVFEGDSILRDSRICWPVHLLFYKEVSVYDHLRKHAKVVQDDDLRRISGSTTSPKDHQKTSKN